VEGSTSVRPVGSYNRQLQSAIVQGGYIQTVEAEGTWPWRQGLKSSRGLTVVLDGSASLKNRFFGADADDAAED
jgi:hypothetical protein